jgi:hypothetical protein
MKISTKRRVLDGILVVAVTVLLSGLLFAQSPAGPEKTGGPWAAVDAPSASEPVPALSAPILSRTFHFATGAMTPVSEIRPTDPTGHRFWDRENTSLFAVSGAWAVGDFFVTKSNLGNGGRELNPVARLFTKNTPLLATNFALETGGVIGLSYFFHQTGHHKLERMASYVNIGASAGAVAFGLAHR